LRGVSLMGIDSGITLMRDRIRIWKKLSKDWKPGNLEKFCREELLENLPDEIGGIQSGEQVGKVVVNLKG